MIKEKYPFPSMPVIALIILQRDCQNEIKRIQDIMQESANEIARRIDQHEKAPKNGVAGLVAEE